jgi:hypothetical protein
MARTQELASLRMQPLADRFELRTSHLAAQAEQLRSAPVPLALHTTVFVVVVAVFQVTLGVTGAASHGSYRQHKPTLTLFEIWMQIFKL